MHHTTPSNAAPLPTRIRHRLATLLLGLLVAVSAAPLSADEQNSPTPEITGELKKWHKITFTFEGPETDEQATPNPFLDYRFDMVFHHPASGKTYRVPGYFAADGRAAHTAATAGNKWRVHFCPDETGEWTYSATFYAYRFVAVSEWETPARHAKTGYMHGATGTFTVAPSDKTGRDFRARGRLQPVAGERYLRFAETGEIFFKCGADAPEKFLAYADFDGTFHQDGHGDQLVKTWAPHLRDWREGDPTWGEGRGKAIIGALNYLAAKGLNAVSFLTLNIAGDDKNVFPYVDYDTFDRFDVSKLDQWAIVFEHADHLGIFLHFKTQEAENQGLLDGGALGALRRLYYRELIARFGHYLALNWNMGEEIGEWQPNPVTPPQYTHQRLAMAEYFHQHDPYGHHRVIHNGNWFDDLYGPASHYTGASLQTDRPDFSRVHGQVLRILEESSRAGKLWAVAVDEPGDAQLALVPDAIDPAHDNARQNALWGAFLAGAWGLEWYFGYKHEHSDLTCQDWRSRDRFWDQCRIALEFFQSHDLPYPRMQSHDELIVDNPPTRGSGAGDYCFAAPGEAYIVYIKHGDAVALTLEPGEYDLQWYNPRTGGPMQTGSVTRIDTASRGAHSLGEPPAADGRDWVALLTRR